MFTQQQIERFREDRSAAEIRESIYEHVAGEFARTPSKLSRRTIVEAVVVLDRGQATRAVAAGLNETKLRQWLADLAGIDGYDPAEQRSLHFRREELHEIDRALEEHLADGGRR